MTGRSVTRARRHWLPTALAITCVVPACHPRDGRLLVLDLTRSEPGALDRTARPWRDAGYDVEARPSYPHLTHADLERYFAVLVLGGRGADSAAERLGAGDLVLLGEWVERGGVVVLGYTADEAGSFDRWMMNRWLAWRGAGITIGDPVAPPTGGAPPDSDVPVAAVRTSALRGVGTNRFAAGRHRSLAVSNKRRVLVRAAPDRAADGSGGEAVLAASRLGRGLVVVASRHALSMPPPAAVAPRVHQSVTRLLTALASWSRRPAEWAGIPPAGEDAPLALLDSPLPVDLRPPLLTPPPGTATLVLRGP